ncbi:hypothetical protein [Robertkochia flava]|uniref:hypothetical protein n=1 Tax=Robertkochia flava TaxID=3447986 RepID=UPI001CC9AA24|nr:hypothetical protein [Robertkochia marina]
MVKYISFGFILLMSSCIPYALAPNIDGNKLVKANRFKRDLPKLNALVFEDPFDADVFLNYLRNKYPEHRGEHLVNIPFEIDGKVYYLSGFERERATKTFNLFPVLVDGVLESNDIDPVLEENYTSRTGKWYILLTVTDGEGKDCLSEKYADRLLVANYLRLLYYDYLNPLKNMEVLQRSSAKY